MNSTAKIVVNEKKRTVVAIVNGCQEDAVKELLKCDSTAHILFALNLGCADCEEELSLQNNLLIPDTFVGIARCHEDDDFDVEVGKKIALTKLHKSYNKAKKQVLKDFTKKINRFSDNLENALSKIEKKIEK